MKNAPLSGSGRKLLLLITVILSLVMLITSCGSSSKTATAVSKPSENYSQSQVSYDAARPEEYGVGGAAAEEPALDQTAGNLTSVSTNLTGQRKIIMEGNVSVETKDFDASIKAMDRLIDEVGGFAESRTVRGTGIRSRSLRDASFVIRVPSEKFDYVMNGMGSIGTVLESNSEGTDITEQYMDYEVRVKNLKVQEQTLLEIMEKSTKLEDVIALESRISEVRYEIEKIENSLRNYDRLIAYSRITVYIQEVDDITETEPAARTLNERITNAFNLSIRNFRLSLENFLVWLAASWISLIFLLIVAVVILLIVKKKIKKKDLKTKLAPHEPEPKDEKKD